MRPRVSTSIIKSDNIFCDMQYVMIESSLFLTILFVIFSQMYVLTSCVSKKEIVDSQR